MQADPKAKAQTLTATLSLSSISLNTMRVCSRIQHESTTRTRKTLIQQLKNKTETSTCNRNQSKKITSRKQTSLVGDNENLRAGSGERSRK
jgi:hypothetical protein